MPYYLAPLITGVHARGRSPVGSDSVSNWIILDPDNAVLWLEIRSNDSRLEHWADDADEVLNQTSLNRINTFLGDRVYDPGIRFEQVVADFMMVPPPARWPRLRASRQRQRFEIWLGPEAMPLESGSIGRPMWERAEPAGHNSKTFVDNFNRSNADLNGSTSSDSQFTWLEVDSTALTGTSNQVSASTAAVQFSTARANADLDTDDHYAQLQFISETETSNWTLGVLVRWTGSGNGYAYEVGGTASFQRIYKYSDDSNVAQTNGTITANDTIYLEVDGSSLIAKVNGSTRIGPSTDTSFTGQLRCGIAIFRAAADGTLTADNFECGDLTVAGRTTKNTRAWPLGTEIGMNWRQGNI